MCERVGLKSVLLALAFVAPGGAWATWSSDIDVITTVTPTPSAVTYSTASLPTYASYDVTLAHYSGRNELVKPVSFSGSTVVVDANNLAIPGLTAVVVASSLPPGCTIGSTPTSVRCTFLNGLYYKTDKINFSVTVSAPSGGHHVNFVGQASWVECDDYRHSSVEYGPVVTATTALSAPDPLKVSSYVPSGGGTLYTGSNNGIPTPTTSSTWAAKVSLPSTAAATTASIVNLIADPGCPRAPNLLDCSSSTLTIPGTFANLVITLRRDASTINRRAKIASAIVYYDNPAHPAPNIPYAGFGFHVPACTDTSYGGPLPRSGIPCIQTRSAVYAPRTVKDRDEDCDPDDKSKKLLYWEFIILAVDNGRFIN
ncbi:MAG: hypothetical protein ABI702_17175 [Burkholderiales bacterium]